MTISQKLWPKYGVEALHQKLYLESTKTKALIACQEDKAAFVQDGSRLKTQIILKANSYGAAGAICANPISTACRFLLGEGNTLLGIMHQSLANQEQTVTKTIEPSLGVVNYLLGKANLFVSASLGLIIGGITGGLLGEIFSPNTSFPIRTLIRTIHVERAIQKVLHAVLELPLAQIAGLLSLAICSIPYLVCSLVGCLVGCLVGMAQKPKDPFTNPQELVLKRQDFIALSNALTEKAVRFRLEKDTSNQESVFDCANIKNIFFKQCHKIVDKQLVVDNQATQEYYQKMLLSLNSSIQPEQRVKFTLLPIMVNNQKQWVIAIEDLEKTLSYLHRLGIRRGQSKFTDYDIITILKDIMQNTPEKIEKLLCFIEALQICPSSYELSILTKIPPSDYRQFIELAQWLQKAGFAAGKVIADIAKEPGQSYERCLRYSIMEQVKIEYPFQTDLSELSGPTDLKKLMDWLGIQNEASSHQFLRTMLNLSSAHLGTFVDFAGVFLKNFSSYLANQDRDSRIKIFLLLQKVKHEDRKQFLRQSDHLRTSNALPTVPCRWYQNLPENHHYWVQLFECLSYLLYKTQKIAAHEFKIESITAMSAEEYQEFANLCQPLKSYNTTAEMIDFREKVIVSLSRIEKRRRPEHLQKALEAADNPNSADAQARREARAAKEAREAQQRAIEQEKREAEQRASKQELQKLMRGYGRLRGGKEEQIINEWLSRQT